MTITVPSTNILQFYPPVHDSHPPAYVAAMFDFTVMVKTVYSKRLTATIDIRDYINVYVVSNIYAVTLHKVQDTHSVGKTLSDPL